MKLKTVICKIIVVVALSGVIAITAGVVFIENYDWNNSRSLINQKVSEAIGRNFTIDGNISIQWLYHNENDSWESYIPRPRFMAENIHVQNPVWTKKTYWLELNKIYFDVRLLPLLHKEITIPQLVLDQVYIDLERKNENKNNWYYTHSSSPTEWKVNLQEVAFSSGKIDLIDDVRNVNVNIAFNNLEKSIALSSLSQTSANVKGKNTAHSNYGLSYQISGTYNHAQVKGKGKTGGLLSLIDSKRQFPIQSDLKIGHNHLNFEGVLSDPVHLAAFDVHLNLSSISMARLYDLAKVTLPETSPFKTQGHLIGNLRKSARYFKYENFTGTVGGSDLSGTLYYVAGPQAKLTGSCTSEKLVFADLAPLIGADSNAKKAIRGVAPQKSSKTVPTEQFRTERWRAMDADVVFNVKHIIQHGKIPVSNLNTHIVMTNGVLDLSPLEVGLAGGEVKGNIHLDGSSTSLKSHFAIHAQHLQIKQLFPKFEMMHSSLGQFNGNANISSVGNSPADWTAHSNGELKLILVNGAISSNLLETAGLNVANMIMAKLFGDKTVNIKCAVTDLMFNHGIVEPRVFAVDTDDAFVNVSGKINLINETMDLNIDPKTKGLRIFSLRSPLYVKGSFKDPQMGVQTGPLLVRGGSAIGLGLINPFAALLALTVPSTSDNLPCSALMAKTHLPLSSKSPKQINHSK